MILLSHIIEYLLYDDNSLKNAFMDIIQSSFDGIQIN